MEYFLCLVLFGIGMYALLVKRNLLKIIIGIALMGYSVNLLFILAGYRAGGEAPLVHEGMGIAPFVDPLAQALVLVTIVVGLAVTILLAALAIRLHEKYGTFDITEIRRLKG